MILRVFLELNIKKQTLTLGVTYNLGRMKMTKLVLRFFSS